MFRIHLNEALIKRSILVNTSVITSWKVKSISALMAMLFALNLFAVAPVSSQHSSDDGIMHSVSDDLAKVSHAQDAQQHDHVEHCGVASCSMALTDFNAAVTNSYGEKILFSVSAPELASLHHTPLPRPPSV